MSRRLLIAALTVLALPLALARCAGCSEECSGRQQGSEGCPCQTDQDCTTLGAVLLCAEGSCAPGDPPDASGHDACDADADCGQGEACGADGSCQPAPACQRLEISELVVRTQVGAATVVSSAEVAPSEVAGSPQADCGLSIEIADPAVAVAGYFGRDGTLTATGCTGRWFAAHRAGLLRCGELHAVSAPGVTTCVGDECDAAGCRVLEGEMGVCP